MVLTRPSQQLVREICRILDQNYPKSRLGNKKNPLNEYLYILLSLRTHEHGASLAYKGFKRRFRSWKDTEKASEKEIEEAIKPGGLAAQKAKRIYSAIKVVKREFGQLSLNSLKSLSQGQIEKHLLRLPGVGLKSARCIMMYSWGFSVLPIDIHVARISRRLGWINDGNSRQLYDQLEEIVEPSLRCNYHIRCVQHGRAVCRGQYPRCNVCCLATYCYYKWEKE